MPSLSLNIDSIELLYQCYMPFVENGGLFIPTDNEIAMNERVHVDITVLSKPYSFDSIVVWITPRSAEVESSHPSGIGIQIPPAYKGLQADIEAQLVSFKSVTLRRFTF